MGIVIDTCIIINLERNKESFLKILKGYENDNFYISAITVSELLHGVYRAKDLSVRNKRHSFVEAVIRKFPVLSVDLSIARIHAEIWSELMDSGQMIGAHDLWIAASCVSNGFTLITDDTKDFKKVPGLEYRKV